MKPTLQDLKDLALGAGEILRAGFKQTNHIENKGEIDLVTETDRKSEAYLLDQITSRFPEHQIIAEESGQTAGNPDCNWYIDPLDGTTNFAHGLPIFSVSIAYAQKGELLLGVVYDPVRGELFSAQRGRGAYLGDRPIHTGSQTELSRSLLVTGFPYDRFTNLDNNLDHFNKFALRARGVRRLGSAALDLCFVAANRVDGFWEIRLESWDMAAGMLISREAGASVTTIDGTPDILTPPHSIVAANRVLHEKMLRVLALDAD